MEIRATECIARETLDGLTDEVLGLINPTNDNTLAPWMMARTRAQEIVMVLDAVCTAIAARPMHTPGAQALRAVAAVPECDVCGPEEDEIFTAYEMEAERVAEARRLSEAQKIDAAKPEVFNMAEFASKVFGMSKGA